MRSPATPEKQGVAFVELFFDLVFVFAVTQTVDIFFHGHDGASIAQGAIIGWLVWWAWTQFTWTLNAADTTNTAVVLMTLAATAIALFMTVDLPRAFGEAALLFAFSYVVIRLLGLLLFLWVSSAKREERPGVVTFTVISLGGLVMIVAGALVGGAVQAWLWLAAIALDLVALGVASHVGSWSIHPEHFCERHGLFVIIALGESLIVSAYGVHELKEPGNLVGVGAMAAAMISGMWWLYFARFKPRMDRAMEAVTGGRLAAMARDAYSLIHFLILAGIICAAVTLKHGFEDLDKALNWHARLFAISGAGLYGGGTVLAFLRVNDRLLTPRLVLTLLVMGAIALPSEVTALAGLVTALVSVVALAIIEHRTLRLEPDQPPRSQK